MDQGVSDFGLPPLLLFSFLCFHLCWPLPETSQASDHLVMNLTTPPNLLNPSCPLGSFMKLSSTLWADIVPVFTHQTFITTVCCRELDLNLSLLSESTFHRSQNMRERYLTSYTKIPLLTAWSQVLLDYLLNEGLLKLIGNILRSVGFSFDYYISVACVK